MESIHLQGMGRVQAKKAKDIKIGTDYFIWNYGLTSKPIKIIKETPTQILFKTMTNDGETYERRLKKNRLVAYVTNEDY